MELPRFTGAEINSWIYKAEKYFQLHAIPKDVRLQVVSFHFVGEAAAWYQWMDRNGIVNDWDHFLIVLQERFGSSAYDDPLGRIAKLAQTGRVSHFRSEFEGLMNRIVDVSESMFLNFFIWGLKPDIRRELLINPPKDLTTRWPKHNCSKNETMISW